MDRHILIVDDEENLTYFLKKSLAQKGYTAHIAHTIKQGRELLDSVYPDLMLLDQNLPDGKGLELYSSLRNEDLIIPTIVITAHSSLQSAIDAIKMGVDDYIAKPFDVQELILIIESLMKRFHLRNQLNYYRRRAQCSSDFDFFLSDLGPLKELQEMAVKIAGVAVSTVLIEGATGTGKEMFARFIHNNSAQADNPFIEINCASLPENLLESELFGYEPGAFTDAKKRKIGLLELADGGTLFLDEIGEMSIGLQAKLLRFLENHTFKRLGGVSDIKVELRVIAATNRNIEEMVKEQHFREDLFFRLNLFRLKLPGLAQRKQEILLLAQFFVENLNKKLGKTIKTISPQCHDLILEYDWPGNLRELNNVLERALILSQKDEISVEHLPHELHQAGESGTAPPLPDLHALRGKALKDYLNDMEKHLLIQAMTSSKGNQVMAARLLNEPRHIIRYLLKKHDLQTEEK